MTSAVAGNLPLGETPPQRPDRRPTDTSFEIQGIVPGPVRDVASKKPDRRPTEVIASDNDGVQLKPSRMPSDPSLASFDDSLPQLSPMQSTEPEERPSLLKQNSRHTVESAQGAPQLPGRRRSSSFANLDNDSSNDEESQGKEVDTTKGAKHGDKSTPDPTSPLYSTLHSSAEVTTDMELSESGCTNQEITV